MVNVNVEAICEDIGQHFKDSNAYHRLCSRFPVSIVEYHLAWWFEHASNRGDSLPNLRAFGVGDLGRWYRSPQGTDFWCEIQFILEDEGYSFSKESEKIMYDLSRRYKW